MSTHVVFMLEERSMKEFLESLVPRLAPELSCTYIEHEGKSDLEKSLPRKLRGWRTPGTQFVVVRDQDSADCRAVKACLLDIAREAGKPETIVRIACRELEAWILGDMLGAAAAFGREELSALATKEKFRNPDSLSSPSKELATLLGGYSKTSGARAAGAHVAWERNQSTSFCVFVKSVLRLVAEQRQPEPPEASGG